MCTLKIELGPMAAALSNHDPDAPALNGYGLFGAADVPTGYADSLAHGIDFDTPGASIFGVVFGYAYQQLAEQAAAEFATGGHTLH